jgi:hypothetical protein
MKLRVRTHGSGADACVLEAEKRRDLGWDWDEVGAGGLPWTWLVELGRGIMNAS